MSCGLKNLFVLAQLTVDGLLCSVAVNLRLVPPGSVRRECGEVCVHKNAILDNYHLFNLNKCFIETSFCPVWCHYSEQDVIYRRARNVSKRHSFCLPSLKLLIKWQNETGLHSIFVRRQSRYHKNGISLHNCVALRSPGQPESSGKHKRK